MNLYSLNDVIATIFGTLCRDTINNNAHRHSVHDNFKGDNDIDANNEFTVVTNDV